MKTTYNAMLAAGFTTFVILAGVTTPAFSKCIQPHPLLGIDTYVADKYCQKKSVRRKSVRTAMVGMKTSHKMTGRRAVREMQSRLTAMGYNPGPADGVSGPDTKKAAGEFNMSVGLPANASTSATLKTLRRISGN